MYKIYYSRKVFHYLMITPRILIKIRRIVKSLFLCADVNVAKHVGRSSVVDRTQNTDNVPALCLFNDILKSDVSSQVK